MSPSYDCVAGALPGGLSRTTFFDGMVLMQADVANEQRFWRVKRRLTNRALGQGVVWGLKLTFNNNSFHLTPGYGLDCCGNDLVVDVAADARVRDLFDEGSAVALKLKTLKKGELTPIAIQLQYVECPEEPRAVHKSACSPDPTGCQTSRVRETARLTTALPYEEAPGAIAKFGAALAKLEADAAKNSTIQGNVFPGLAQSGSTTGGGGPGPGPVTATPLPLSLHVRIGEVEQIVPVIVGDSRFFTAEAVVHYPTPTGSATVPQMVSFELRPDPGHVILRGNMASNGQTVIDKLTAPFQLLMAWSYQLPMPGPNGWTGGSSGAAGPQQLPYFCEGFADVASLFGGDRHHVIVNIHGSDGPNGTITVTPLIPTIGQPSTPSQMAVHIKVDGRLSVEESGIGLDGSGADGTGSGSREGRRNCFDPLTPGAFFLDSDPDQLVDPKAILLEAFYVFLKQTLNGALPNPQSWTGPQTLASWIYLSAWRLLFGADPDAPDPDGGDRAQLAQLLNQLLQDWCDAFLYPGPSCPSDDSHGVVLGTAMVDSAGNVRSFDSWQGRRYVLTGPVLSYWAGQFGFAPLDVVAGRFARTICCLAQDAPLAMPALADQPSQTLIFDNFSQDSGARLDATLLGKNATLLSDGCYLLFGDPAALESELARFNVNELRTDTISLPRFVAKVVECLNRTSAPDARNGYIRYRLDGRSNQQVMLYVLASDDDVKERRRARAELRHIVVESFEALQASDATLVAPPLALPSLTDYVVEFLDAVALSQVVTANNQALNPAALYDELFKLDLDTLADLIARDPEEIADLLHHDFDAQLNLVYGSLQLIVDKLVAVLVKVVADWQSKNSGTVFSRQTLATGSFLTLLAPAVAQGLVQNKVPLLNPMPQEKVPNAVLAWVARSIQR